MVVLIRIVKRESKGRSRVIEDGVVIREVGEAKSREILQRTIED
jgi:hypothetical protein